jgi:hypothetical protein
MSRTSTAAFAAAPAFAADHLEPVLYVPGPAGREGGLADGEVRLLGASLVAFGVLCLASAASLAGVQLDLALLAL